MTAILLCRSGDDAGLAQPLHGRCLIGRSADCDLAILHPSLSREHAHIDKDSEGRVLLTDLGSMNGTVLKGERLKQGDPRELSHLDHVTLGVGIEFVYIELEKVPMTEIVAAHLLDDEGNRVPLQLGVNTMGSSNECDLIVPDDEVAPIHARLVLTSTSLTITKEPSARRLVVSSEGVESARIKDGDLIALSPASEFGIELICGFSQMADVEQGQTKPSIVSSASDLLENGPVARAGGTPGEEWDAARAEPDAETQALPAKHAESPQPEPEDECDETLALSAEEIAARRKKDHDATQTEQIANIQDAVKRARDRHRAEMAKSAREAQEMDTHGPGTKSPEMPQDPGLVRRGGATSPDSSGSAWDRPQQPKFKAARREAAARIHYKIPGEAEELVVLLREGRHQVGREASCRVQVGDDSISRIHAEIHVGPQGVTVKDLGSANGTYVEGERITKKAKVPKGSEVRFGDIVATFESL